MSHRRLHLAVLAAIVALFATMLSPAHAVDAQPVQPAAPASAAAKKVPIFAPYLVIVAVQASRAAAPTVIRVTVKETTKKAAKKTAKKIVKKKGYKVKSVKKVTHLGSRMAPGHTLRYGTTLKKEHGYKSFDAFKKKHPGGKGHEWHHIVEQNSKVAKREIKKRGGYRIHNKDNLILLPTTVHRSCVNSLMSGGLSKLTSWEAKKLGLTAAVKKAKKFAPANVTVRQYIGGYSLQSAYHFGLLVLDICGVGPTPLFMKLNK